MLRKLLEAEGVKVNSTMNASVTSGKINGIAVLWSSFFVTLLAKKYHYSIMQLPLLHAG